MGWRGEASERGEKSRRLGAWEEPGRWGGTEEAAQDSLGSEWALQIQRCLDVGGKGVARTRFMCVEEETYPTMVGEPGVDGSITAKESEREPVT